MSKKYAKVAENPYTVFLTDKAGTERRVHCTRVFVTATEYIVKYVQKGRQMAEYFDKAEWTLRGDVEAIAQFIAASIPGADAKPTPLPDQMTEDESRRLQGTQTVLAAPPPRKAENDGEYNVWAHFCEQGCKLKHEHQSMWGDPAKVKIFDAVVTAEATMQEARRKLAIREHKAKVLKQIEGSGNAGWTD